MPHSRRGPLRWLGTHPFGNHPGRNIAFWAVLALLVVSVAATGTHSPKTTPAADQAAATPTATSPATSTRPGPGTASPSRHRTRARHAATAPPVTHRHPQHRSTTPHHHARPVPVTGGDRHLRNGAVLPNAARTPGAANPAVTQASIGRTICTSGWTSTIRPPSDYTTGLKEQQLATGYSYHGETSTGDYEEDHLISLELGGSPTSPRNLWPEPYNSTDGARIKDQIENKLNDLVCSHAITLAAAQHAIATNWYAAYRRWIGVPSTPVSSPPTATHSASPPPAGGHGCTTTSSGSCIRAGEFCAQAEYGQVGYDANGTALTCEGDQTHPHWS